MDIREKLIQKEAMFFSPLGTKSVDAVRDREIEPCTVRTDFQRDRDRILHCKAFRRLKHKTQVFLSPEGDHYRTRLTHTLEVSQIARTVARALFINEDLTEAIALGHDLGHTPYGHAGERALNECSPIGYNHAKQSVRVVEKLENNGEGLNLTEQVRDGMGSHSIMGAAKTAEGKLIYFADKIAYMNHDTEDAIAAGIINEKDVPWQVHYTLGRSKSERITTF
ncbi:MAG: dNTP triphosphohydrolase, partial [Oscillospiraceae bacterium]